MKTYTGSDKRAKWYDGKKDELCEAWKNPMVRWLRHKERQEARFSTQDEAAGVMQARKEHREYL